MAKIEWTDEATRVFRAFLKNARLEFGESTVRRWQKERKSIEWRLERYPDSYPPEVLLQGKQFLYRLCHIMNRRFKFIYYYDQVEDTVHIVDIWDSKSNPKALVRRIR